VAIYKLVWPALKVHFSTASCPIPAGFYRVAIPKRLEKGSEPHINPVFKPKPCKSKLGSIKVKLASSYHKTIILSIFKQIVILKQVNSIWKIWHLVNWYKIESETWAIFLADMQLLPRSTGIAECSGFFVF